MVRTPDLALSFEENVGIDAKSLLLDSLLRRSKNQSVTDREFIFEITPVVSSTSGHREGREWDATKRRILLCQIPKLLGATVPDFRYQQHFKPWGTRVIIHSRVWAETNLPAKQKPKRERFRSCGGWDAGRASNRWQLELRLTNEVAHI
jgi:hypothetical protein